LNGSREFRKKSKKTLAIYYDHSIYYGHSTLKIGDRNMKKIQPSNLELQVLSVLWDRGPSTAREVLEAMPDGKQRAYTTVLSVMQVMEKKGLLKHSSKGNAHVYKPTVTRRQTLGPMLKGLVSNVFGGSVSTVMQHLLDENNVDECEFEAIRRLLDEHESGRDSAPKKVDAHE
jgi:BlaI family penicillinase repressor